jgi:hypothetical protein
MLLDETTCRAEIVNNNPPFWIRTHTHTARAIQQNLELWARSKLETAQEGSVALNTNCKKIGGVLREKCEILLVPYLPH